MNQCASLPFGIASAPADGHPLVTRVGADARGQLETGERVLRLGARDLRGVTAIGFLARAYREARADGSVLLEVERSGERREVRIRSVPAPLHWWNTIPFSVATAAAALVLLVRAQRWRLRRRFFVGALCFCIFGAFYRSLGGGFAIAWAISGLITLPIAISLSFWSALEWIGVRRALEFSLVPAVVFALLGLWTGLLPAPRSGLVLVLYNWLLTAALGALLVIAGIAYRRAGALHRRQARWAVLGLYVGVLPFVLFVLADLASALPTLESPLLLIGRLALVALPLGLLVGVLATGFLDVDRVISVAASYNVLAVVLLGASVSLLPRAAALLAKQLGTGETASQVVLSLALAALVVPAHRALRPRLDRLFFPEHFSFELGMRQLLEELAHPANAPSLMERVGEQLCALLRPESLVIYAREESSFAPVFAQGTAVLPPLPARGPLVAALEGRASPLAEPAWAEKQQFPLDAFDRAALESLGAALVLPVQRAESLALFVTLGPKRSGDLYTTTELALLTALTSRLSEALGRLGEADLLREAHAMQAALRRYVPGAVAERVARGEELSPGTRDVTVLFVDIRGYTRLSEGLAPPEIFSTVSRYTRSVSELITRHGGSVVEFHGDGLFAVFGAPDALPRKERAAVEAAREALDAVEVLSREEGSPPLAVGVGIATGSAYVGNVRAHDREIWTVLGNPTNLAARLQALTRELGASIALDAATHRGAGYVCADFVLRPALEIRGRSGPVDVWSLPIRSAD